MDDFGRWLKNFKLPEPAVEDPELPEGVYDRDGEYFAVCCSCEREYVLLCDLDEFDPGYSYCGGNPWCLP